MSAWTAEESAAYEARQAAERKIADAGNLALRAFLKEARKEELKEAFGQFLDQVRNEFDLWAMYNLLVSAYSSASLFEGLRSMLQVEGAKAIWDSFEDDLPEAEPGDEEPYSGKRSANILYADDAAKDTSWINETPKCETYELVAGNEYHQAVNLTRGEYKKLKYHLAELRGIEV